MKKESSLKERYGTCALVTGASSGIGKAIIEELAVRGFDTISVGRNETKLNAIKNEIEEKYSGKNTIILADLSTSDGIKTTIDATKNYHIGLFVHAAGMESHGLFTKNSLEYESKLINLNINSTMHLTHHFASQMEKKGKGGILLVSSLTAHMISPYFSNYSASKAYILNLGLSLHCELSEKGIDISVLSPGLTRTAMSETIGKDIDWSKTPMKYMEAEEVAKEALDHIGRKASIIPGTSNRITGFVARRIAPLLFGKNNAKMLKKAFINQK